MLVSGGALVAWLLFSTFKDTFREASECLWSNLFFTFLTFIADSFSVSYQNYVRYNSIVFFCKLRRGNQKGTLPHLLPDMDDGQTP